MARWTDQELASIRPRRTASAIAKETGRTESAVRTKAKSLGVPLRASQAARRPARPKPPSRPALPNNGDLYADLIEAFISTFLTHTEDQYVGKPFLLEDWQRDRFIRPVFGSVDETGTRTFREVVLGLPRNAGKSEIAAAICLAIMFTEPVHKGKYVVVARNRTQARIVFDKARSMVYASPELRSWCEITKNKIIVKETGAEFFTVAYDAGGAQGIHAQVVVIDEYHVHKDDSMRHAMLSGMVGRPNSLLVTISTAGEERRGPLWDLLKRLLGRNGEPGRPGPFDGPAPGDPRAYVCWIGASDDDDGTDPAVWRKATPQSWVTDQDLLDMFNSMPFPAFERYHLNRFPSKGTNRAYPATLWHACGARPVIDPDLPSVLGLDAAFTRDTTALLFDQVDADGFHNVLAWVWRKDDVLGHIDHEAVEAKIVELCEDFNVTRIACDANYFTRSMLKLQNEYGLPIEEFQQSDVKMAAASMMLLDVLKEGRLRHGDNDELTDQVLNAGMKVTPRGWRLGKVQDDQKIDAAVALAIAAYIAEAEAHIYRAPTIITA